MKTALAWQIEEGKKRTSGNWVVGALPVSAMGTSSVTLAGPLRVLVGRIISSLANILNAHALFQTSNTARIATGRAGTAGHQQQALLPLLGWLVGVAVCGAQPLGHGADCGDWEELGRGVSCKRKAAREDTNK